MAVIPVKLLINEKGFAKIEIGLGKGKKLYDKRETLKKRDAHLEIERKKREK
jgi:SsrA-binding protein